MSFSEVENDPTMSDPASQDSSDVSDSNDASVGTLGTPPSETSFETKSDSAKSNPSSQRVSNPSSQSFSKAPKSIPNSQLPGSQNITPSKGTIFITLGILVPIMLLFVALFSGTIQP